MITFVTGAPWYNHHHFEQAFTRPLSKATETTISKLNESSITSNNYLRTLK